MSAGPELRPWPRRNPLSLLASADLWTSVGFLFSYLFLSGIWFAIALAAGITAAVFAVTLAGIPVLVAASGVIRFAASAERHRASGLLAAPLPGRYRDTAELGIMAKVRTRWRDGATWRDLAYLLGLWAPLWALDLAVTAVWLALISGIAAPLWYRYPQQDLPGGGTAHGIQLGYFPHGPHGPGGHGFYITTLPQALVAAVCFLVAFLLFNYVVVATARAHTRVARAVLGAHADPLAPARGVLASPGPLGPLKTIRHNGSPPVSHSA
jgi:Putative sensor